MAHGPADAFLSGLAPLSFNFCTTDLSITTVNYIWGVYTFAKPQAGVPVYAHVEQLYYY